MITPGIDLDELCDWCGESLLHTPSIYCRHNEDHLKHQLGHLEKELQRLDKQNWLLIAKNTDQEERLGNFIYEIYQLKRENAELRQSLEAYCPDHPLVIGAQADDGKPRD